jgi:hypothetical protein
MRIDVRRFKGQRVLILGDVNTGKTRYTAAILDAVVSAEGAGDVTVIDLAPRLKNGIGGRLRPPAGPVQYLTTTITPPRLTAREPDEVLTLARGNAAAAERLFDAYLDRPRPVLFVNDASLYLQAGGLERFIRLLAAAGTAVVNAYCGNHFPDSPLSRRERRLTDALTAVCDRIERLF